MINPPFFYWLGIEVKANAGWAHTSMPSRHFYLLI